MRHGRPSPADVCRNPGAPLSADTEVQELAFLTNLDATGAMDHTLNI